MQLDFTNKPIAAAALRLASDHHRGIVRKYCGESYINHPMRVAETLLRHGIVDQETLAAALLHDCMEDEDALGCRMNSAVIQKHCGTKVTRWVEGLTAPQHSAGNRARRKEIYNTALRQAPWQVKAIKCADILDNVRGISKLDPDFAETYLAEKETQLDAIKSEPQGNYQWRLLWQDARDQVARERNEFALHLLGLHREHEAEIAAEEQAFAALVEEMTQREMPTYAVF